MKNNTFTPAPIAAGEMLCVREGIGLSYPLAPVPLVMTLIGNDGTRAQLTVNNGKVTFEGDPDAAAEMFIDAVTRRHAQQWTEQQQKLDKAEAQLAEYAHHNGLMMLSQRLVDAEKERDTLWAEVHRLRSGGNVHCNQCISCSE
ncbi:hypothetical protein [Pantoea sp. Acro-807]|uniref:hypothetical protein n=1 Tax=Pantoea sp. Acro-807 TaxID=2608356 RepID=UPI00141A2BF6|nr:hypothetical protein [Pantoea sp. Acro-807]NIE72745.1 hypothetical protein [Pantoea sp. Acro-807]